MCYLTSWTLKAVIEIGPVDMTACDNGSRTIIGKHFRVLIFFFLFNSWTTDLIHSEALTTM